MCYVITVALVCARVEPCSVLGPDKLKRSHVHKQAAVGSEEQHLSYIRRVPRRMQHGSPPHEPPDLEHITINPCTQRVQVIVISSVISYQETTDYLSDGRQGLSSAQATALLSPHPAPLATTAKGTGKPR
jgi:hypothetical protein